MHPNSQCVSLTQTFTLFAYTKSTVSPNTTLNEDPSMHAPSSHTSLEHVQCRDELRLMLG